MSSPCSAAAPAAWCIPGRSSPWTLDPTPRRLADLRDLIAAANDWQAPQSFLHRLAYSGYAGGTYTSLRDGTLQHYFALEYYALVRFGRWDQILKTLPPDTSAPYPHAVWHFARGMAYARTAKPREARKELAALERVGADPALKDAKVKNINLAASLARIATLTLQAELATGDRKPAVAVKLLEEATAIEDGLDADEPHLWLAPTRHALGPALLRAGRAAEAERRIART